MKLLKLQYRNSFRHIGDADAASIRPDKECGLRHGEHEHLRVLGAAPGVSSEMRWEQRPSACCALQLK
jgi:hypothetical protein